MTIEQLTNEVEFFETYRGVRTKEYYDHFDKTVAEIREEMRKQPEADALYLRMVEVDRKEREEMKMWRWDYD